jgi:putative flippase GtrA
MAGLMGQVSLMNTYAHIHTPIMISLVRSVHGLWLGGLIGVILIFILNFIFRKVQILNDSYEGRGI